MPTTMLAAGMRRTVIVFSVMVRAMNRRVEIKRTAKQSFYCLVRTARNTAVQLYAGACKCIFCTLAYSSADKRVDIVQFQKACKRTVSAAKRRDYAFAFNFVIFRFIHLESFGVSEMLKNLSVLISYCYFLLFLFSAVKLFVRYFSMIVVTFSALYH